MTCVGGDGVVYELMRDADVLCEVIRRGLQVDSAGARSSVNCYNSELQPHQLHRADDSFVTASCDELTTAGNYSDQPSDIACSSTTMHIIPPVVVVEDDVESLPTEVIVNAVTSHNIDYDA